MTTPSGTDSAHVGGALRSERLLELPLRLHPSLHPRPKTGLAGRGYSQLFAPAIAAALFDGDQASWRRVARSAVFLRREARQLKNACSRWRAFASILRHRLSNLSSFETGKRLSEETECRESRRA
jgi:hypothetical protein